jgi:hypothetical protein
MLVQVIRESLDQTPLNPQDAAISAVAMEYARLIDEAVPAGKYGQALTWLAQQDFEDKDADKHIRTISLALAQHSVASDFGPKLLATLEALLMSPRARAAAKKAVTDDKPIANPIDQLASRRAGKSAAAAMDATAP